MKHKIILISLLFSIIFLNYHANNEYQRARDLFMLENEKMTLAFVNQISKNVDRKILNLSNLKKKIQNEEKNLSLTTLAYFDCINFLSVYQIQNKKKIDQKIFNEKIYSLDKNIDHHKMTKYSIKNTIEKKLKDQKLLSRENKNTLYSFCTENNQIINYFVFKKNAFPNFITQIAM